MCSDSDSVTFRAGYDDCSAEVSVHVEAGAGHLAYLLYSKNYTHALHRQSDRVEDYRHHHYARHGYAGRAYGGHQGGQHHSNLLAYSQVYAVELGYEQGRYALEQGRAVQLTVLPSESVSPASFSDTPQAWV